MFCNKVKVHIGLMIILFAFMLVQAETAWPYRDQLKPDVLFWKKIFSHYSSQEVVIHDARDLSRVYKTLKFDNIADPDRREKMVEDVKTEIGQLILSLSSVKTDTLSGYSKYLYSQFKSDLSEKSLKQAAENIRAQQGLREQFYAGVNRSELYLSKIKEIFKSYQLPEELAFLPHVESSFNPVAKSHVGAAGMWQIMRSTARRFLRNNRIVDQRYDVYAATEAAAQIIKYNFKRSEDWALALTAYNFGLAGILRAKKRVAGDYIDIRKRYKHRRFKFASRNFYPEFLAVIEIMADLKNRQNIDSQIAVPELKRYQLKKKMKAAEFSSKFGIPIDSVKKYNPAYKKRVWQGRYRMPADYWVYLPETYSKPELAAIFHGFEPQPALLAQAELPAVIAAKPERENSQSISPVKLVPEVIDRQKTAEMDNDVMIDEAIQNLQKRLRAKKNLIEIFAGETLGHIADWLNMPISRLRSMNRLSRKSKIYQGQQIKVDFNNVSLDKFMTRRLNYHKDQFESELANKPFSGYNKHIVREGDTIWKLLKMQKYTSIELIQYFNSGQNINKLKPGDILKVPLFKSKHTMEDVL